MHHKYIEKVELLIHLCRLSIMVGSFRKAYNYLKRDGYQEQITGTYKSLLFQARNEDWMALREVFLEDEYGFLDKILHENDETTILDLGANIGLFALRAFSKARNISVHSIEAAHDTAIVLEQNIQQNPDLNWKSTYGAVWHENGSIFLKRTPNSLGHSVGFDDTGEEVPAFTLDAILQKTETKHFDIVKIDIEGAEEHVVPKNMPILSKAQLIIIEIHDDRINGDDVINPLKTVFTNTFRIKQRKSTKPVYIFCQDGKYYNDLVELFGG